MTCASLEALCIVVDCEINRELNRLGHTVKSAAVKHKGTVRQSQPALTSQEAPPLSFPRPTLRPSPSALLDSFIKVEAKYNQAQKGDASGTCASEMSDEEHYPTLDAKHGEHNNNSIFPFIDDGLLEYGRKYPSLSSANSLPDDGFKASAAPSQQLPKRSARNQGAREANLQGDSSNSQQLPLFRAQWGARDGDAAEGPQARPAASGSRHSGAVKREYVEEEAEAPVRKQPRLTGFAARMSGTSSYRGVSWHTQTSRWKAQIKVAGKDVNLGRHRDEVEAARAYDRAAICARGAKDAKLNFQISDYQLEIPTLISTPLTELAASLRGVEQRLQAQTSRFHGVRLNKRTSKWEAYIRVAGKHVHLGCYDSEVAAAQAFDQAALVRQAHNLGAMGGKPQLVTNFPPMIYLEFTNQLFQLANPLMNGAAVQFNKDAGQSPFCKLEDKYVQNLLQKCREQGGSLTAYPSIVS